MNNDPNAFLRSGMMQPNQDNMNLFMTNSNNSRIAAQNQSYANCVPRGTPLPSAGQHAGANYLAGRFQNMGIGYQGSIVPPMRGTVVNNPCIGPPQSGPPGFLGASSASGMPNGVHGSLLNMTSAGGSSSHGSTPANLSPNMPRRPTSMGPPTSQPVAQERDILAYSQQQQQQHQQQQQQQQQRGVSPVVSNSNTYFYSASNIETTKKLQESNGLVAPSWFLYPPVPDSATHLRDGRQHLTVKKDKSSFFMDPELRHMFLNRIRACLLSSDENLQSKLPRSLNGYEDLTPVESVSQLRVSTTFNVPSLCLKAFSPREGRVFLLRRMAGLPQLSPEVGAIVSKLRDIQQPNLIPVREVFHTEAFGDSSVVLVFDFHPCSVSLLQSNMSDPMKVNGFASPFNVDQVARPHSASKTSELNILPEPTAWKYLVQLIHVVRYVHRVLNRSCRVIDPSKVLIQDGQRIRLNCFGALDLLTFDPHKNSQQVANELAQHQMDDLVSLGKLMISVTCGTAVAVQESQLSTALDLISKRYRPDLVTIIARLIGGLTASVDELVVASASHCYDHIQHAYSHNDFLERQLMREMESGRLFRLCSKLMTICERVDLAGERDWSEMEDRYMLKLFRDFVFHQTDQNGAPWLDLAHIVTCLNKLDAASPEKVCLVSRDSQNMVIVTYADLKKWLDQSFAYLMEKQRSITGAYYTSNMRP